MPTVRELVDATFRTWLEPPDYQPPLAIMANALTASTGDDQVTLGTFALPEDEQLLRVGVLLEIDAELVRVVDYDDVTDTATVRRGELGTSPSSHPVLSPAKISPPFPRQSVFEAVAENVATLAPPLFTVRTLPAIESQPGVVVLDDDLATSVIDVMRENRQMLPVGSFALVDHHPQTGTRSVLVPPGLGNVWIRYRRRVLRPESEADDFEDLGLEPLWAGAVMAGAAGQLLVGADVPRTTTEWVSQVLETQGVQVGKRQQLGFGLVQYRQMLVERFKREMTQEYRSVSIVKTSPWVISEGGIL